MMISMERANEENEYAEIDDFLPKLVMWRSSGNTAAGRYFSQSDSRNLA